MKTFLMSILLLAQIGTCRIIVLEISSILESLNSIPVTIFFSCYPDQQNKMGHPWLFNWITSTAPIFTLPSCILFFRYYFTQGSTFRADQPCWPAGGTVCTPYRHTGTQYTGVCRWGLGRYASWSPMGPIHIVHIVPTWVVQQTLILLISKLS